jgi:very-short-patch-repair endonuclease
MDLPLTRRRQLRTNGTDAKAIIWRHLRARRFVGCKFRRQHSCGPYILDFFCPARKLAIEIDSGQHFAPAEKEYDERRTRFLIAGGITVLRFQNDWVLRELDGVLAVIAATLGVADPSP